MYRGIRIAAVALVCGCLAAPAAGSDTAATDKVNALVKDYASINRDLRNTQAAQSALMQQKSKLDTTGAELSKRQDALNSQANAHNSEAAAQQAALAKSKSDCNNGNQNSSGEANACDNNIKKLNQKTAALNASVATLQQQQSELDLEYAQYHQAANDWSEQEQQTMTELNTLYRALNDWADRADELIGGEPFQEEVEANHADKYCLHHELPDGVVSIEQLQSYSTVAERCLKYVAAQRRLAHAAP